MASASATAPSSPMELPLSLGKRGEKTSISKNQRCKDEIINLQQILKELHGFHSLFNSSNSFTSDGVTLKAEHAHNHAGFQDKLERKPLSTITAKYLLYVACC